MKKIKCIAIDDEPMALELIKDFCFQVPIIDLVNTFNNPVEAFSYLETHKPDLLFLDIHMPEVSGIQLAEAIGPHPLIIFTTAHSKYAVKSYKLNAVDYLLKPFDFERFHQSVKKAKKHLLMQKQAESPKNEEQNIVVKVEYRNVKIKLSDILYLESMDNYTKIHTSEKTYITQQTLKALTEKLPDNSFFRIHKSFTIPFNKIETFSNKEVVINNTTIPVGRTYSKHFLQKIQS